MSSYQSVARTASSRVDSGSARTAPSNPTTRRSQKPLSLEKREKNAAAVVFDPRDNVGLDVPPERDPGEILTQYQGREKLLDIFERIHVGPNRSDNLSKIIMNRTRYGVEYDSFADDMINVVNKEIHYGE